MVGAGDFNVAGSLTHKNSEHRHKGGRSNSDNQNSVRCRSVVAGASCPDLIIPDPERDIVIKPSNSYRNTMERVLE